MKTLPSTVTEDSLLEEVKKLNGLCDRSRSKDQFASLHPTLFGGQDTFPSSGLSDLIVEAECLMLSTKEAEWAFSCGRRYLKVSTRVVTWALNVLERKNEEVYCRVLTAFSGLDEQDYWKYWKRISLEFEHAEYKGLIQLLKKCQLDLQKSRAVPVLRSTSGNLP
jgi:transposase-like protein